MLPEGREVAWATAQAIHCIMPGHEREINLSGETLKIRVPRLKMVFNASGQTSLLCGDRQPYRLGNIDIHGNVCFGHNTPQNPYEAWHFFWGAEHNDDLSGPVKHRFQGECPEAECDDHEDGEHPVNHQCRAGNCHCGPECVCSRPRPTTHACSYWADHDDGSDSRCHCCMGTCGHGPQPFVCSCDASEYMCPCDSGDCDCESERGFTCERTGCGCGTVDEWKQKLANAELASFPDFVGGRATPGASEIPSEAMGIEWPSRVPFGSGNVRLVPEGWAPPTPPTSLEGYRFKVGDAVIAVAPPVQIDGNFPAWWATRRAGPSKVKALLDSKWYLMDGPDASEIPESYLKTPDEVFRFAVGSLAVGTEDAYYGCLRGRALTVATRRVVGENVLYSFRESGVEWPPGGEERQDNLRPATDADPRGFPGPTAEFAVDDVVRVKTAAETGANFSHDDRHLQGRTFRVERIRTPAEYSGNCYGYQLSIGHVVRGWDIVLGNEADLEQPLVRHWLPTYTTISIKPPPPGPLPWYWPDIAAKNPGLAGRIYSAPEWRGGMPFYTIDTIYGQKIPEPCLEVTQPMTRPPQPRTIVRTECGDSRCKVCRRFEWINPLYQEENRT